MTVHFFNDATATNRLKVALGNLAITPAAGQSVDSQGAAGQLVLGTNLLTGGTPGGLTGVLATFPLQFPSFSFVTPRQANLLGCPMSVLATGNGTATKAEIRDNLGNTQIDQLTVGNAGSGADIIIVSPSITVNSSVTCNSGTLKE
jgi:hypothetical protein